MQVQRFALVATIAAMKSGLKGCAARQELRKVMITVVATIAAMKSGLKANGQLD